MDTFECPKCGRFYEKEIICPYCKDVVCRDAKSVSIIKRQAERIKEYEDLFDELIFFLEYIEANHEPRTSREWIDRLEALKGGD